MGEIKQFANDVIPKPKFIFDEYKVTNEDHGSQSIDQQSSEVEKKDDYFSFFSSHEKVILKPESNFKNLRQFMEFLPIDYYILLQKGYEK